MKSQNKFMNVGVIASLNAIMKQNTAFYQSDFEIDKKIIQNAAKSPNKEEKTLLWLCRPHGTNCFREQDVFLKDSAANITWLYHYDQGDRILAYTVEITGKDGKKIIGNLYELDFSAHCQYARSHMVGADIAKLLYEKGERFQPVKKFFDAAPDPRFGKYLGFETLPNDPEALAVVLKEEKNRREQLEQGDFSKHIASLFVGLIKWEAKRIEAEIEKNPNCRAQLSSAFLKLATKKDIKSLFSILQRKAILKLEQNERIYAEYRPNCA